MSKLSYSDRKLIEQDIRLRADNDHLEPCWDYESFGWDYESFDGNEFCRAERPNEFLQFIDKCMCHANRVGDDYIYAKLNNELFNEWKEVT